MGKYINAEKLNAEIERLYNGEAPKHDQQCDFDDGYFTGVGKVFDVIDSLQKEQPESSNGKFVFPNFLYARTVDNKTIDVSYAPQSLDAVEYIKNDPTEQPEVDLDFQTFAKEMVGIFSLSKDKTTNTEENPLNWEYSIARHFYDLGLNARKQ